MRNYFFRACIVIGFLWSIISNTLTYGLSNMPFDWKFILVGGLLFGLIFYLGMVLIFGRMINYYGTARVFNLTLLNRKKAISEAIKNASRDDIIVILGRGNEEYQIIDGTFDNVSACKYTVPTVTSIGRVYQTLILDVMKLYENIVETIKKVYSSFISEEISDFNSNVYYSNPDYIKCSYEAGELLD